MNDISVFSFAFLEQLERLTDTLEHLTEAVDKLAERRPSLNIQPADSASVVVETATDLRPEEHLSRFLENLPNWHYNCLRRKMIPASLAAKVLGISMPQLATLTRHDKIKAKGGRYDLISLLMWLDSVTFPETEPDQVA